MKKRARILTRTTKSFRVSYTPESRKALLGHKEGLRKEIKRRGQKAGYSVLRDLITPSSRRRLKKVNGKTYLITPSKPFIGELTGVQSTSSRTFARKGGKQIETVYWLKEVQLPEGKVSLWVKEQRDPKSLSLEKREIEDALEQKRKIGVGVPDFFLRVEPSTRRKRFTVTRFLENTMPVDKFVRNCSPAERERVLETVRKLGLKLIEAGLFPTQTKGDHILISNTKPYKIFITDSAAGFTPTFLNRLVLLQTLKANPRIRRPNWDDVYLDFSGMQKYWERLPVKARKEIQKRQLDMLISEIRRGPKGRSSWQLLAQKVYSLSWELFPESRIAKKTRPVGGKT